MPKENVSKVSDTPNEEPTLNELIESYYDIYVDYYNKNKSPISVLSELENTKTTFRNRLNKLEVYYKNQGSRFIDLLEEIVPGDSSPYDRDLLDLEKEIQLVYQDDIEWLAGVVITKLKDYFSCYEPVIGYTITRNQIERDTEYIFTKIRRDPELYLTKINIEAGKFQSALDILDLAFDNYIKAEKLYAHIRTIEQVQNKIVESDYKKKLEYTSEMSEEEKDDLKAEKNSNNHKLHKSFSWMDVTVEKVVNCESEDEILLNLRKVDKDFKKPNPNRSLYLNTGRVNNAAVAECLAVIHNKQHPFDTVKEETVKTHYPELSLK